MDLPSGVLCSLGTTSYPFQPIELLEDSPRSFILPIHENLVSSYDSTLLARGWTGYSY